MSVYCGSETAIQVAAAAYPGNDARKLADALIAAHHPKLGLDRSVCLRDVYDALSRAYHPQNPTPAHPADFVEQRFGRGD